MTSTLAPAMRVAERYRLDRPLGRGGMGEVWAAEHERTGRRVALKVLHAEARGTHRERLIREARAAGSLEHPNVCEVLDVLEHEGSPVLVMPLLRGETLADRLAREKTLSARDAAALLAFVASGVGAAHAAGVVHRDLKPANIFLTDDGGVKVLDFGIAKLDATESADKLTATGSLLGTPLYMSPEQALGEKDVDHRSDVWSLGIVLYECLTGVLPTEADNVGQTIKKVLFERLRPVAELAPDTPPALAGLVGGMLERRRGKRVADMREVVTTLCAIGGVACTPPARPATTLGDSALPEALAPDDVTQDNASQSHSAPTASSDDTRALATTEAEPPPKPPPRRARWVVAVAVLGVAATGALAWRAPTLHTTTRTTDSQARSATGSASEPVAVDTTAPARSAVIHPNDPGTGERPENPSGPTVSAATAAPQGAAPPVASTPPTASSTPRSGARAVQTSKSSPTGSAPTQAPAPSDSATTTREALRDRR